MKAKLWEKNSHKIKALIQLLNHIEFCMVELMKIEEEVRKREFIFDLVLDEGTTINEKLNKISKEKLKVLNSGIIVEFIA